MIMCANPNTCALPPISFFIINMPAAPLRSRPPVSKQTPLPTSVTFGSPVRPHFRSMRRGARLDARPTAWIAGKFFFSRSSPTMTLQLPLNRRASFLAASASSSGPMSAAGVLIRSRVRKVASTAPSIEDLSALRGQTNSGRASGLPLYRVNLYAAKPQPRARRFAVAAFGSRASL